MYYIPSDPSNTNRLAVCRGRLWQFTEKSHICHRNRPCPEQDISMKRTPTQNSGNEQEVRYQRSFHSYMRWSLQRSIGICLLQSGWKGTWPRCWNGVPVPTTSCTPSHFKPPYFSCSAMSNREKWKYKLSSIDRLNLLKRSFINILNQSQSDFEDFCQIFQSSKTEHLNRLGKKECPEDEEANLEGKRIIIVIFHSVLKNREFRDWSKAMC